MVPLVFLWGLCLHLKVLWCSGRALPAPACVSHILPVTVVAGGGHGQSAPTSNTIPLVPGPCCSPWLSLAPKISKITSLGLDEQSRAELHPLSRRLYHGWLSWAVALRDKPAQPQPWGQAWPYLACSQEALVPSASVQVLLCVVASERTSHLQQIPPALLNKVAKEHWKL